MPNSNAVIQHCPFCLPRDPSRGLVTPPHYTQLPMTDLALGPPSPAPAFARGSRSAPAAGRAFTSEAARWSSGVLHAEELVTGALGQISAGLAEALLVGSGGVPMRAEQRAARRLIGAWLAGVLADELAPSASLIDAEHWFTGDARTAAALPLDVSRHAHEVLRELAVRDGALEMLPYALDPIPHEYRRDLLQGAGSGAARAARKERGSFYTPTDVADHIVEMALSRARADADEWRILDPAAGTGVFLRSAFAALLKRDLTPDEAVDALHGLDIDECCVDMTAFVLLVDYLRAGSRLHGAPAIETWSRLRQQLAAVDTLLALNGTGQSFTLFDLDTAGIPWLSKPFDVIVGNPPYARVGSRADLPELAGRYAVLQGASTATDIYTCFVELLCSQLAPHGAGCLVVPMSLSYSGSPQLRQLRNLAVHAAGDWTFEFFDRTPDALFGDDVKQRTAIVTRVATDRFSVTTGPVMRWTSRTRSSLFEALPRVPLGPYDFAAGIPKLGSAGQADVFQELRREPGQFSEAIASTTRVTPPVNEDDGATVYVAGTAYNWLSVYRDPAAIAPGVAAPTTSPLLALTFRSPDHADAAYAALVSRLTFWLWRVEGDAFHVTGGWIEGLPYALDQMEAQTLQRLQRAGRSLWEATVSHPVVSVNGGRTTVSYCPHAQVELLDAVDYEVLAATGVPRQFKDELTNFVRDLTTAGRDSTNDHGLRRALASWKED